VVGEWRVSDDAEPLTETMDDDDFLATLEAYNAHRGTRSRSSVSEPYIPPPLAAKLAALAGTPLPPPEPPKSPEQRAAEQWTKSASEYKDMKQASGRWRPAKKVWAITETEPASPVGLAARTTPLPASPVLAGVAAPQSDNGEDVPLSPRVSPPVEDPAVTPEDEERAWMETRLRWGDALLEPNSAISGFAPLNLRGVRGSAEAAAVAAANRRLSGGEAPANGTEPQSAVVYSGASAAENGTSGGGDYSGGGSSVPEHQTVSPDEYEQMLLAAPVKHPRHSEAEHLALVAAYVAELSAAFFLQSSQGTKLVKHSKYGFPKAKLVKLNWETGVLSWGSGEVRMRDVTSMKLHRFSGTTMQQPSAAATPSSIAAAAALTAKLSPKVGAATDAAPARSPSASPLSSPSSVSSVSSSGPPSPSSPRSFKASSSRLGASTSAATVVAQQAAKQAALSAPKGHFLFTIFTPTRSVQLDAPTAFDRELWLLGLYNYHLERVLKPLSDPSSPAYGSASAAKVLPINTINFEIMPSGEMRLNLQKSGGHHTDEHQHESPVQSPRLSAAAGMPALAIGERMDTARSAPAATAAPAAAASAAPNIPWWQQQHPSSTSSASIVRPAASFLTHVSRGASLVKHSRSGKPKHCTLTISPAGVVSWKGKESLPLREAVEVVKGHSTKVFEKSIKDLKRPPPASRCFSILMPARTLDLEVSLCDEHRKRAAALRRIALANKAGGGASGSSVGHIDSQEEAEEKAMEIERDAWIENLKRMIEGLKRGEHMEHNATHTTHAAANPAAHTSAAASSKLASIPPSAAPSAASSTSSSSSSIAAAPSPAASSLVVSDTPLAGDTQSRSAAFSVDEDALPPFVLLPERLVPVPAATSSSDEGAHNTAADSEDGAVDDSATVAASSSTAPVAAFAFAPSSSDSAPQLTGPVQPMSNGSSSSSSSSNSGSSSPASAVLQPDIVPPPVALPPSEVAPVVGWRRSLIQVTGAPNNSSDAPMLIHDTDSESDGSSSESESGSEGEEEEGPTDEEAERKIADAYRKAQAAGASAAEAATSAAAAVPSRKPRGDKRARGSAAAAASSSAGNAAPASAAASDDEDDEQSAWEQWEDASSSAAAAAPTPNGISPVDSSGSAAPSAHVTSVAFGEDASLAALLRLEPVSAVHVPETNEQLAATVAEPEDTLIKQIEQRDERIRQLEDAVARLTAQNQVLQEQLQQANARADASHP